MTKIKRVVFDSNIFGAAIEDEDDYDPRSFEYWEIVSTKALFRLLGKLTVYGCPPVERELRMAPEPLRSHLLNIYSKLRTLETNSLIIKLSREYAKAGIYAPDAFILAHSSAHRTDALITMNKRHLKNPSVLRKIRRINKRYKLPELVVLFPSELFELLSKR